MLCDVICAKKLKPPTIPQCADKDKEATAAAELPADQLIDAALCIGSPRVFEYLRSREKPAFLLDLDARLVQYCTHSTAVHICPA